MKIMHIEITSVSLKRAQMYVGKAALSIMRMHGNTNLDEVLKYMTPCYDRDSHRLILKIAGDDIIERVYGDIGGDCDDCIYLHE
jgi:hypothetical protein